MYIFLIALFIIVLLLKFFQKKEQIFIKELIESSFYAESFNTLTDFSQRESKLKKAATVFLTIDALNLALENGTFHLTKEQDYQEICYHSYVTMLESFPSISGVIIFSIRNKKLRKTYFSRNKFFDIVSE